MRKPFILLCGILACTTPLTQAVDLSFIRGPLTNTGVDIDASGSVRSIFKPSQTRLWSNLKGLTPGATYQFTVDGFVEAEFTAGQDGKASVQFRVEPTGEQAALDFDPRGKEIAVSDGTANVLSMIYSGPEEPVELTVDERTSLTPVDDTVEGRVEARYLDQKNKTRFILHFLGLTRGVYTLRVAGEDKAEVDLSKGRSALVNFEINKHGLFKGGPGKGKGNGKGQKNRHALDFDPRGELIEVVSNGTVVFSDVMLAKVDALPVETTTTITLVSSGADVDATGSADIVTSTNGRTSLTVTANGLTAGVYDVSVGGTIRGTLTVADDGLGGTTGSVTFVSEPNGVDLPLDFPLTGNVEVSQLGTVYLSAPLP